MNIITFDNLLKIPKQDKGLYIIENQSWEYCLKLWKKYNMESFTHILILR